VAAGGASVAVLSAGAAGLTAAVAAAAVPGVRVGGRVLVGTTIQPTTRTGTLVKVGWGVRVWSGWGCRRAANRVKAVLKMI